MEHYKKQQPASLLPLNEPKLEYGGFYPMLTSILPPHFGPRYLNSLYSTFDYSRVSHAYMRDYYSFILGGNISLMGVKRDYQGIDGDITEVGNALLNFKPIHFEWDYTFEDYDFYQPGFIEHLPFEHWCIRLHPTLYVVRCEIDCVGYSGLDRFMNLDRSKLLDNCLVKQNILPSFVKTPIEHHRRVPYNNIYKYDGMTNFIWFSDNDCDMFVHVTDYDCYSLATKTHKFPGIDYFVGKKGYVYRVQNLFVPCIVNCDGYRFWFNMYNDLPWSVTPSYYDHYFAGSSLRQQRSIRYESLDSDFGFERLFQEPKQSITVQGGMLSTLSQLNDNISQIGQFARSANSIKDSVDTITQQQWFQSILHYVTSIANQIASIVQDFIDFKNDPVLFMQNLFVGCKYGFSLPEGYAYDATKTGLILAAAAYLFEKSQMISVGLFLYGYHSFFSTCYRDSRYARAAAIITTLTSIGVMKMTQLRPVSVSLQTGNSLTHMVYAMCTFVTLGFASSGITSSSASVMSHLMSQTKNAFAFARGTLSVAKCVEYVVQTLQTTISYVFGTTIAYATLVKLTITSKDLQEYIQYCLLTQPEDLATKLTLDFDARRQWDRICVLHKDLIKIFATGKPPTETHIGYSMYVRACTAFGKLKAEYDKIKDSLDHFRVEPFMVWLWGKPGTGKTWCRDKFVNNMYRWHSTIDPNLPDVKRTGLLYVRNPADKFMSKYNGEFALGYDDVGQNRQQDNPEFNEIMSFGSTNQVRLNMADLEDKGRLFSSKLVIMAANSQNVSANNLILKEDAFNRRRHVVIEVRRPTLDEVTCSTSKCDFTKVSLHFTDPITGKHIISFPEQGYGDDNETFIKMFEWLAPQYVKHVKDQIAGLEQKEQALSAILNGDRDPSIFEIDNEGFSDASEIPPLDPLLDSTMCKFLRIGRLLEYNEDFRLVRDGILNCYRDGMETPTEFLRNEFNNYLDEYGIPHLNDTEWKVFKLDDPNSLTLSERESIDACFTEQTTAMESRFPWITVLKTTGIIASMFALYKLGKNFFSGETDLFDLQGYSIETKAQPTPRVMIQNYNVESKAPKTNNKIVVQDKVTFENVDSDISNIDVVTHNLSRSLARFTKVGKGGNYYIINGFNVCYNVWMIPRHFFDTELEDIQVQIEQAGKPKMIVTIEAKNITQYYKMDLNGKELERDLCFVRIPQMPHGRNHLRHFATYTHLERVRNFKGKIIRWNPSLKTTEEVCMGDTIRWDKPFALDHEGTTLHYSSGYKYNFDTSLGDCGSVLISLDTTTQARIFGIHFGYDNIEKRGLSCNIPREDLETIIEQCVPKVDKITEQEPFVEVQNAVCPVELIKDGEPLFEYFGYVKDGPLPPKDHGDLNRSPLFDSVYPAEKDLSVLSKFDNRLSEEHFGGPDILTRGVVDFAYESIPWPTRELDIATEALKAEFALFKDPIGNRLLTQDEAINGIWIDGARLEFSEPLNLKTAAGYGLPGTKRDHFSTEEIFDCTKLVKVQHTVKTDKLQQQIDSMWSDWMDGKTHSIPWSHTLKVEAIKKSKIPTGNTRTFCVASSALLVNVRRLFGAFTTAMKSSKVVSFSCLGVDANSQDWNDLYNNLRSTGPKGADMDFFKFDRTAVTWQLARKVCEAINHWYDDGEINARARIIAFEEMIFAYGLVNKHLTRKNRGNPSGNPLTTELNNCVNYAMLCMVYLLIAKAKKPEAYSISAWKKNVNMKAYGDDIIFTLFPECAEWFDFLMLEEIYAKYGVPVTPADKSDNGICLRDLHELTFLKRNFLPFKHPYIKWQSGLSKTSIRSMIQFYRLKPNNGTMLDAIMVNCRESLNEAYHWGKEFFEEHKNKINTWMKTNDYPQLFITFEELDVIYRKKLEQGF